MLLYAHCCKTNATSPFLNRSTVLSRTCTQADKDCSGTLTLDELNKFVLSYCDLNSDGEVTASELLASFQCLPPPSKKQDDGDGFPAFPSGTTSLLSRCLTKDVYTEIKDRVTSGGITLQVSRSLCYVFPVWYGQNACAEKTGVRPARPWAHTYARENVKKSCPRCRDHITVMHAMIRAYQQIRMCVFCRMQFALVWTILIAVLACMRVMRRCTRCSRRCWTV